MICYLGELQSFHEPVSWVANDAAGWLTPVSWSLEAREALSSRSSVSNQDILPRKWHALEEWAMTFPWEKTQGGLLFFHKGELFHIIHRELHESVWEIAKTLTKYTMEVIHKT